MGGFALSRLQSKVGRGPLGALISLLLALGCTKADFGTDGGSGSGGSGSGGNIGGETGTGGASASGGSGGEDVAEAGTDTVTEADTGSVDMEIEPGIMADAGDDGDTMPGTDGDGAVI